MAYRRLLMGMSLWMLLSSLGVTWGSTQESPEYTLKAAFLYNFIQFTEWPDTVGDTLKVCVFGNDPFGDNLNRLNGKAAGKRLMAIYRTTRLADLKECHVVFVSRGNISQLPDILEIVKSKPVLTVADSPNAAKRGIMLNMETSQNKVIFDANMVLARHAGLSLSSRLLKLCNKVYQ